MNADRGSPRGWPGAVLRAGFRRLLGVPGAVSLRAFTPAVRAATVGEAAARGREDAGLSAAVRGLSDPLTADAPLLGVALASLREAGRRSLGERATDEQLLACVALASGHAVEMDTGEGKTLAGALAAALLAPSGRRVHVFSVNDYLAERDAEWMAPLFALLGIRVAWVGQRHDSGERRAAYRAQVVYAPVSEEGFDVLRDRFAESDAERVLPVRDVALVDEADAVLIDEAAVPLVLAGEAAPPHADHTGTHNPGQAPGTIIDHAEAARLVSTLAPDTDFTVEEDGATVTLTDAGLDRVEAALGEIRLYEPEHVPTLTRVNLALHARTLLTRDVHYLVRDGSVTLVNDARGRLVHRQRWPDGLHAAIEAKERLGVSPSGVVLDSLTVHDLIAEYRSVAGMSGTLVSVARELLELHGLPTARVPRSVPSARIDHPDRVFETAEQLRAALVQDVSLRHASGQPVLIATRSVAESESIAAVLRGAGLTPRVLNARDDAREAALIARAGEPGALTVSTQMSGRGTDIRLGGAEPPSGAARAAVIAAGGLAVLATGRQPSRRLDAQLRGRAGRQGEPGDSQLYASLDDAQLAETLPAHLRTRIRRSGGALPDAERRGLVEQAQRIGEERRADRLRSTRQHSLAIARQRRTVLARRAELEATPGVAGRVGCFTLDEAWTDHLGLLQEIRDGIHLRSLAGQNPTDEFHRIALAEFAGFFAEAEARASRILSTLGPADEDRSLAELGLRRPGATWTYLVSDDPLGTAMDRAVRALGGAWRRRVLRIE